MNRKYIFIIPILFIVFLLCNKLIKTSPVKEIQGIQLGTKNLNENFKQQPLFFNEESFFKGVSKAEKEYKKSEYVVKGGISPHHLLPGYLISNLFLHIKENPPENIILIGPNHYEQGENVISAQNNWETPFGVVEVNTELINTLSWQKAVVFSQDVMHTEHSVGALMPYIKYYLPKTKVIPIILRGTTTEKEMSLLIDTLKPILSSDKIIILASVDFSHYLDSKKAIENDILTKQKIENNDYEGLLRMNNDYLDSPKSLITFLTLMNLSESNHKILDNTNSGILIKNNNAPVTSYFLIIYF